MIIIAVDFVNDETNVYLLLAFLEKNLKEMKKLKIEGN